MRVKKIAVRSWLNRNGVLNLELFNFAPDKNQPLANRWAAAHYCAAVRVYSESSFVALFSKASKRLSRSAFVLRRSRLIL